MTNGHDRAYWLAVHLGAVAAAEIPQPPLTAIESDLSVSSGDMRIVDNDLVSGGAADSSHGLQHP